MILDTLKILVSGIFAAGWLDDFLSWINCQLETERIYKYQYYYNTAMDNPIKKLQENLARDLVSLEDTDMVSEPQLEKITDVYSQVYDIISKAVDKSKE